MLETVKTILLDYQEAPRLTGVSRRVPFQVLPGKASVCIGVRRAGKSTFMFQLMDRLLEDGVPRENILYLNFFDDRLHALRHEGLAIVSDAYFSLYPEKKGVEVIHVFFDEMQAVTGWEAFVERLMRTEKCQVYLTGSSAQMLSREVATQMRGRALSWEMFPFSFREFLDWAGIEADGPLSTKRQLLVRKAFAQYREQGGFPEAAGLNTNLRVKLHQEYFQAILFRDLIDRHDVGKPNALMDTAHWLVDNVASLYSINRLMGFLKALGHRISKGTVAEYLRWFEDAYFLYSVPLNDASAARRNTNPRKIYCVDHAMVTSLSPGILHNSGHLLENLVFVALRRINGRIYYHRTAAGREVDFVVHGRDGRKVAVQVSESLADPRTRKRELAALDEAMGEIGLTMGLLITGGHEAEEVEVGNGRIKVLPCWRFLLDAEEFVPD